MEDREGERKGGDKWKIKSKEELIQWDGLGEGGKGGEEKGE